MFTLRKVPLAGLLFLRRSTTSTTATGSQETWKKSMFHRFITLDLPCRRCSCRGRASTLTFRHRQISPSKAQQARCPASGFDSTLRVDAGSRPRAEPPGRGTRQALVAGELSALAAWHEGCASVKPMERT